jgi:hypothetical protein
MTYRRLECENGSRSRRGGFYLQRRFFLWRNFSERLINARRLARSQFAGGTLSVQAHDSEERSGIGIQQEVASGLHYFLFEINPLWMTILNQQCENKSCGNHGT